LLAVPQANGYSRRQHRIGFYLRVPKLIQRRFFMATAKKQARGQAKNDAVQLLIADHKKVQKLFKDFEKLKEDGGAKEKSSVVQQICMELRIHTTVEEEIFYPAVRESIGDDDLMDEADVEHEGAKSLVAQLEAMKPGDDHYDAKVTVLGEQIDHHVEEEQDEMFPKAKRAKVNLEELGERIMRRKQELQANPRLLSARS
jgi:hemerythrin superfamily protein